MIRSSCLLPLTILLGNSVCLLPLIMVADGQILLLLSLMRQRDEKFCLVFHFSSLFVNQKLSLVPGNLKCIIETPLALFSFKMFLFCKQFFVQDLFLFLLGALSTISFWSHIDATSLLYFFLRCFVDRKFFSIPLSQKLWSCATVNLAVVLDSIQRLLIQGEEIKRTIFYVALISSSDVWIVLLALTWTVKLLLVYGVLTAVEAQTKNNSPQKPRRLLNQSVFI